MEQKLTIREFPLGLWCFEAIAILAGALLLRRAGTSMLPPLLLIAGGLACLAFTNILTIDADRQTRLLTLRWRSPVRHSMREIPFDNLAGIRIALVGRTHRTSNGRRTSPSFRMEAELLDGTYVPFRQYGTGGFFFKQRRAEALCRHIGLPEPNVSRPAQLFNLMSAATPGSRHVTAPTTMDETAAHVTDGVNWRHRAGIAGGKAVSRWYTPDVRTPGGFLYLGQKTVGKGGAFADAVGAFNPTLIKGSLMMYGFTDAEMPGIDSAQPLPFGLGAVDAQYATLASAPDLQQFVNPAMLAALDDWAQRHPLHTFQTGPWGQLVVLYGPEGLSLSQFNPLTSEQVEELTGLGVALVKAATGSA